MKKVITIFMILVLAISLAVVAYARDGESSRPPIAGSQQIESSQPPAASSQQIENGEQEAEDSVKELDNGEQLTTPISYSLSPESCSSEAANSSPDSYSSEAANDPLKEYVEEKIVPVLMGVITSAVALLSTLKGIFSALKGLKESKEDFQKERELIKESSKRELEKFAQKYEELKELVENVCVVTPQIENLKKKTEVLSMEIANLSEIASLGFCQNQELVKEGHARKIVILSEKNKELTNSEAN